MQTQEYKDYLKSNEWKLVKLDIIQQRGNRCERCKEQRQVNILHLHHKTYVRLFNERLSDLELLCPKCHMAEHGIKDKKSKKPKNSTIVSKNIHNQLNALQKRFDSGKIATKLEYDIKVRRVKKKAKLNNIEIKPKNKMSSVARVEQRIRDGYYKTEHSKLNAMQMAFKKDRQKY
jgi:hypothetical protein